MTRKSQAFADLFCISVVEPIDVRTDEFAETLETFLTGLFDSCCEFGAEQIKDINHGIEALRLYTLYASKEWVETAEYVNSKKLKLAPPLKDPYFELDDRGFIGSLLQIPKDEWGPLEPVLQEYLDEEERLHPEYIKPSETGTNKQPEIRLTRSQLDEIVPVDKLQEKQLLAAYFDTYEKLSIYRGMHDYDDPKAKDFAVRMELIMKRLYESADPN